MGGSSSFWDQMTYPESVKTARLHLERWDPARHTEALAAMNADREVMRSIGDGAPVGRAASEHASAAIAAHWERFGFGLWAVLLGDDRGASGDRRVLGFAGLSHPLWFAAERASVEVGWRLRRDAWGQGFASEAGRAGVEAGFGALRLDRIVAYIRPGNERSRAVSRRLGMQLTRSVAHPSRPYAVEVWELTSDRARDVSARGRGA